MQAAVDFFGGRRFFVFPDSRQAASADGAHEDDGTFVDGAAARPVSREAAGGGTSSARPGASAVSPGPESEWGLGAAGDALMRVDEAGSTSEALELETLGDLDAPAEGEIDRCFSFFLFLLPFPMTYVKGSFFSLRHQWRMAGRGLKRSRARRGLSTFTIPGLTRSIATVRTGDQRGKCRVAQGITFSGGMEEQ